MPQHSDSPRRIAIVHEWFTSMRGGEKCVEALREVFPESDVFGLLHIPGSVSPTIERGGIHTSFIQHLPGAAVHYRRYLPLFPAAVERFDMRGYDLVISSNHCVAKGVNVPSGALHVCYCHTPMRYIWSLYDEYFGKGRAGLVTRTGMRLNLGRLRRWDKKTAANPRHFIANSRNVQERIASIYGRESDVIYPPVDTQRFPPAATNDGFYLMVTALVPYKSVDLAITAFNRTGDTLVIVGEGPDRRRLEQLAGPTVHFEGWKSDEDLVGFYARCAGLVFTGEEDFGIVPVEAIASGKPVLAYAKGGALETVVDGETGVLFDKPTVDSLIAGLHRMRNTPFDPQFLHRYALRFDREKYKESMRSFILEKWRGFTSTSPQPLT
jgi:glycosyltransferase involved in cell wall biosynthesis